MPRPTPEQLQKINRFAQKELTADQVFVFKDMMIDTAEVSCYSTFVHENLIRKMMADAHKGVGLLMNHNSYRLPVGRSYDAYMVEELSEGDVSLKSLYGEFYIDLGRATETNMTTDDLVKGIEAGTIFDTSVGFSATTWTCSICGNDIRDYRKCEHYPGEKYVVNRNGVDVAEKCSVIAGMDGQGELLENSLVYAGACDRATISSFSREGVTDLEKGTKLHVVENFKNIPVDAVIFQYYTKDGSVLFTDTDTRTDGAEQLRKRSEAKVELNKLLEVLGKYSIKAETPEELEAALAQYAQIQEQLTAKDAEVAQAQTELSNVQTELANVSVELETTKEQLSAKDEEITKVTTELAEKAVVIEAYRNDLVGKVIELGIKANGNSFNQARYEKYLATLSIDELKEELNSFQEQFNAKFAGARITKPNETDLSNGGNEIVPDPEDEVEFRNFVAEKAVEYAKEHNVSISEATKVVYQKYKSNE